MRTKKPSNLNFKKNKRTLDSEGASSANFSEVFRQKQENNDNFERIINVLFQFNGETWDAYEVLGLPAGSNISDAKKAFLEALNAGKDSEAFLRAALEAIIEIKKT